MSASVLFLAPLRLEARALRRGAPGASVEQIGMGPAKAISARARILARETPGRPLVLAGVAGALDGDLRPGDVLVANSIGSTETDEIIELSGARGVADLLEAKGLRVRVGTLVSAPAIVTGGPARAHAGCAGGVAVDMEALWCAPLARRHPFAVVRTMLDVPGRELRSLATPLAARKAYRSLVVASSVLVHWAPEAVFDHPLEEVGDP